MPDSIFSLPLIICIDLHNRGFVFIKNFKLIKTLFSYHTQISDLTSELEELKVEQKQHAASKMGKSLLEKECLIADMELILNTQRTFF